MSLFVYCMAGVMGLALTWLLWRRQPAKATAARPTATARSGASETRSSAGSFTSAQSAANLLDPDPLPADLTGFRWLREQDIVPARRDVLLTAIKGIPRPPRSMQKLLSPEFVAKAGSHELSELVMGEPLIAAKVLSTVNSPMYGLQKPVTHIGQAVTFLGMNTVRNMCLQYMLAEAFKPKLAEAQRCFDAIWKASAIASELCVRLGKSLNLPDQGGLSTQVVLSFVGQLAAASLIPPAGLEKWLGCNRLERARLEQDILGLSASEIGCLLMKSWELPESLVEDVGSIGRQLVSPYMVTDRARAPRFALGYLCARLGERFALGELDTLEGYDPALDIAVDTHHLRSSLVHPTLLKLDLALTAPELVASLDHMLAKCTTPA